MAAFDIFVGVAVLFAVPLLGRYIMWNYDNLPSKNGMR